MTSQIGWMSRKRTYSADSSMPDAGREDHQQRHASRVSSSQLHIGAMPLARMKMNTTIRFMPRLKKQKSATDSGTTRRGKRTLRSRFSRPTRLGTEPAVVSWK